MQGRLLEYWIQIPFKQNPVTIATARRTVRRGMPQYRYIGRIAGILRTKVLETWVRILMQKNPWIRLFC